MPSGKVLLDGKPLLAHSAQTAESIKASISQLTFLSSDDFYLTKNGKLLYNDDFQMCNGDLHLHIRLLGGKGGFGSMLRAIGAQIEKTTNREACRDLSGRRLRDINEEKRVKAWMDKEQEREKEAANKVNKKIQKLQAKPKHEFKDKHYDEARSEMTQTVHEALEVGLMNSASTSTKKSDDEAGPSEAEASTTGAKRKADDCDKDAAKKKKKKKKNIKGAQYLGDDLGSSSDSDSDSDSGNSSSRKSK